MSKGYLSINNVAMAFTYKLCASRITLSTLLLLLFLCCPNPSSATAPKLFKKIYAFGDSFTDTGNTNSSTGSIFFTHVSNPPYGRTFFHRPTNRYSDGRLVIDFVAQALSLPFLPPYMDPKADRSHGISFAVAGATAISYRFFEKNNVSLDITPQSLGTQLGWFNRYLESVGCRDYKTTPTQCGDVFDDALFWVGAIGAGDYAFTSGSSIPRKTLRRLAISNINGFIQALLKKGAKYMVVEGLPTLGCLTANLYLYTDRDAMGCAATVNNESHAHNAVLQANLRSFRAHFPHATIVYADYWSAYASVLANPSKYGIAEPFKACCGSATGDPLNFDIFETCGSPHTKSCPDPSMYINWDGGHLTEAMYKAVADELLNGTFCHPPFGYLLSKKMSSG
ncbi:GDSL esterase/lipase At3g48460-like [Ipomoea triloba]|uniref:GDSL esterase/lipase At3g48460-like n=1 Tax=Ipomoea triloba TaxID=35885 RepID=UPI00125DA965|nr:GDSL esterase/lipase At3g48460-like [Ipomoea triloba]